MLNKAQKKVLEAQALEEVYSHILYIRDYKSNTVTDYESRVQRDLEEDPESSTSYWTEEIEKLKIQIQYVDKLADKVLAMF